MLQERPVRKLVRHTSSPKISSSQLLRRLSESPALPALIKRLEPHVLHELIDAVGVQDAGGIMTLATVPQLRAALDLAVWRSPEHGAAETFDPDQFVTWLEAWLDIGPAFTAERLCALGEDYLMLVFAPLIRVEPLDLADMSAAEFWSGERSDGSGTMDNDEAEAEAETENAMVRAQEDHFGDYGVRARIADEWDVVRTGLAALWDEAPDVLLRILARLSDRPTPFLQRGDGVAVLNEDMAHARELAQEGRGFVTPTGARAFLAGITSLGVAAIEAMHGYDEETARHFANLRSNAQRAADAERMEDEVDEALSRMSSTPKWTVRPAAGSGTADDAGRSSPTDRARESSAAGGVADRAAAAGKTADSTARHRAVVKQSDVDQVDPQVDPREVAKLEALLARAGIGRGADEDLDVGDQADDQSGSVGSPQGLSGHPQRLSGHPQRLSGGSHPAPLRAGIDALAARDPAAATERMRELGYLANVVTQGVRRDGVPFTVAAAAEFVLTTAGLGLDWLYTRDASGAARALDEAPGVVRLFGLGWALIGGMPAQLLQACEDAFVGHAVTERLRSRQWLRDEVESGLDDLRRGLRSGDYAAAREALTLLSLAFDAAACRELRAVLGEVPRVADNGRVEGRWIASLADLRRIAAAMRRLG